MPDCTKGPLGIAPLDELSAGPYQGYERGLYNGGSNMIPSQHELAGLRLAECVGRLDGVVEEVPIAFLGFSIGNLIAPHLIAAMAADTTLRPNVRLVNCCWGGYVAKKLADPNDDYWTVRLPERLATAGVDPDRVQVAILLTGTSLEKNGLVFPAHAELLRDQLAAALRNALTYLPNLRLCFLSCFTAQHYRMPPESSTPEPYHFQQGLSVRWVIESQIAGDAALNYDPVRGTVEAPWISWGFYPWCDASAQRADGLFFKCPTPQPDVIPDGIHPSIYGCGKVAPRALAALKANPVSRKILVA